LKSLPVATAAHSNMNAHILQLPHVQIGAMRKSTRKHVRFILNTHCRKKLSIETKRQKPGIPQRKLSGASFKQPYSAESKSPGGYLTPLTPLDRGSQSSGPGYHPVRTTELLGSPLPTSRSLQYSSDASSPPVTGSRRLCYSD